MPITMMGPMKDPDDLDEFDVCSACGRTTTLLIIFRMEHQLISLCGKCIDELQEAYVRLLDLRLKAGYK